MAEEEPNFAVMNETDVRELIVRPLIQRLGYAPGSQNGVRSEVPLRYPKRVLGHRKAATDHDMAGRADYVCDVVSYGRWTVEVKAPGVEISERDWEQAHSYAAHPEIAASHFLITNGKEFRLYSMLESQNPVLVWTHGSQQEMWVTISNVLGPEQIRLRRLHEQRRSSGKALAPGLGPSARIVGGRLEYGSYESAAHVPGDAFQALTGLRATVEGESVDRNEDGLICARLRLAGPTAQWDELNRLAGSDVIEFSTADEYLSVDEQAPTILQGIQQFQLPAGASIKGLPGLPDGVSALPFPFTASAFTQVTGYLRDNTMRGVFVIGYTLQFPPSIAALMKQHPIVFTSVGDFHVTVA